MLSLSIAIMIVAQIADILTTRGALARGGYEMNPVVRFFMHAFGRSWWVAKVALAAGGTWLITIAAPDDRLASMLVAGLAAVVLLVAYNNTKVAR